MNRLFKHAARRSPGTAFRQSCVTLAALASLGLATTQAQAAATIAFEPAPALVRPGQVFELVLQGLGFDSTPAGLPITNFTAGQNVNFSFDSASFEVLGIAIDPRWSFTPGNRSGVIDNAAGTVTGLAFGVFPPTTDDDFRIATFTLRALAPGIGQFSAVAGQFIGQVDGQAGKSINPDFKATAVSVVPEPQTWMLYAGGLWGLGLLMRRRVAAAGAAA